jgi:hypothetical protein
LLSEVFLFLKPTFKIGHLQIMTRYAAAATHFALSALIGTILLALFWFVWYPSPMLLAIGGHEIFLLILGIDVVLGPLLTLIVFRSGKKSLKFDLAVIALMQVGAMAYGVSVLLEGRPAYVAALGDKFQVVQAVEVIDANLEKAKTTLPWWGPKWVGTKAPEGRYDIDAVRDVTVIGGGRGHFPQLHTPYESMAQEMLKKSRPVSELKAANSAKSADIDAWLKSRGYTDATAVYQPLSIRASEFALFLDSKDAKVIGISPFRP